MLTALPLSFEHIEQKINHYLQKYDVAIKGQAISPHMEHAKLMLRGLYEMRTDTHQVRSQLVSHLQKYPAHIGSEQVLDDRIQELLESFEKKTSQIENVYKGFIRKWLDFVNRKISEIEEKVFLFDRMYDAIAQHIQLDVLPNDAFDGERVYLGQGILIMPTTIKSPGYHVFEITSQERANGKREIVFKPLTAYGLKSIEETISKHVDSNKLGTIVIARNTENYPLQETSLPIVKAKYKEGLARQR